MARMARRDRFPSRRSTPDGFSSSPMPEVPSRRSLTSTCQVPAGALDIALRRTRQASRACMIDEVSFAVALHDVLLAHLPTPSQFVTNEPPPPTLSRQGSARRAQPNTNGPRALHPIATFQCNNDILQFDSSRTSSLVGWKMTESSRPNPVRARHIPDDFRRRFVLSPF